MTSFTTENSRKLAPLKLGIVWLKLIIVWSGKYLQVDASELHTIRELAYVSGFQIGKCPVGEDDIHTSATGRVLWAKVMARDAGLAVVDAAADLERDAESVGRVEGPVAAAVQRVAVVDARGLGVLELVVDNLAFALAWR